MPSLKDLSNNVKNFNYYSGRGNFTGNKVGYGASKPLLTYPPGFRWSPSNFDDGFMQFGTVTGTSRSAYDTERITKFLTGSVKGPLFLLKQRVLQRTNVPIEYAGGNDFGPTRQYTPLPLLAQVASNAFGAKYKRHGILPELAGTAEDLTSYENNILQNDSPDVNVPSRVNLIVPNNDPAKKYPNRLKRLVHTLSDPKSNGIIAKYKGGPDSSYGIGSTTIRAVAKRPMNQTLTPKILNGFAPMSVKELININDNRVLDLKAAANGAPNTSSSYDSQSIIFGPQYDFREYKNKINSGSQGFIPLPTGSYKDLNQGSDVLRGFATMSIDELKNIGQNGEYNQGALRLKVKDSNYTGSITFGPKYDFREYKNLVNSKTSLYTKLATSSYADYNLEDRIGVSKDRGKDRSNYADTSSMSHDKVNAMSLIYGKGQPETMSTANDYFDYNGNKVRYTPDGNSKVASRDMVKFRIKSLDNDTPANGVYMIFRSYITAIKRTVNSKWDPYNYVGRGESFYIYDGHTESISISFTIAASSRYEMKPLYQKLNYLISTFTPDYKAGKMRGNISELTIGDFLLYQPGIITSLDMTIDEDTNWEIAIDEVEKGKDKDMKELPHMIKCSMVFIPIYNFLPAKSETSPFIGIRTPRVATNDWLQKDNLYTGKLPESAKK